MRPDKIGALLAQFEALVRNEQGVEFWFARELQPLLGYSEWRNFLIAIDKAKESCRTSGQNEADHFREVTKMVTLGVWDTGTVSANLAAVECSVLRLEPTFTMRSRCSIDAVSSRGPDS